MNTLRVTSQKPGLLKRLDIRLRKIRSLKTSILSREPLKTAPVMARALEAEPPRTLSEERL